MTVDEIKALMTSELEEGAEDNRLDTVYAEVADRDAKIDELTNQVVELTDKVSSLADTNAKLVEQIKYVEPEKEEPEEVKDEFEFEDLSTIYED